VIAQNLESTELNDVTSEYTVIVTLPNIGY